MTANAKIKIGIDNTTSIPFQSFESARLAFLHDVSCNAVSSMMNMAHTAEIQHCV